MKHYTILLVDDDPLLLAGVGKNLESRGYDIVTAESGETAIRLMGEKHVDLVLTDLVMEGMDGIALLQQIKQSDPDTMVMILTGFANVQSAIAALRHGAEDYLIKPCDPQEMHLRLNRCFARLELVEKVKKKTSELIASNEALLKEIAERKKIEAALEKHRNHLESLVKERTENLRDANTALKVLLKKRDEDKFEFEKKMLFKLKELVFPYLEKIRQTSTDETIQNLLSIIDSNLDDVMSPFVSGMNDDYLTMSTQEVQIANLVAVGKSSKEIGEMLNISPRTVDSYRYSIREKIGIKGTKINLRTYLLSIK